MVAKQLSFLVPYLTNKCFAPILSNEFDWAISRFALDEAIVYFGSQSKQILGTVRGLSRLIRCVSYDQYSRTYVLLVFSEAKQAPYLEPTISWVARLPSENEQWPIGCFACSIREQPLGLSCRAAKLLAPLLAFAKAKIWLLCSLR